MKDLIFSYKIDEELIFDNCCITCNEGQCILITGSEFKDYTILGAILGRILPCMEIPDLESLKLLYKDFNGSFDFIKDTFPENVSYIGSDPDRHLIFDEIWEEYSAKLHISTLNKITHFLNNFSLGKEYLYRKITTLSGGEKMKLALSLAFSENNPLIVLHGIIPWLDRQGRLDLIKAINEAKSHNKIIILLEQEYHCLLPIIDETLHLNNKKLIPENLQNIVTLEFNTDFINKINLLNRKYALNSPKTILTINNLNFSYMDSVTKTKKDIFENLNLELYLKKVYCLLGENGTGKSSLAHLIFKQEKANSGNIKLLDKDLNTFTQKELNQYICFVAQFPENQLIWNTLGDCRKKIIESGLDFSLDLFNKYFPHSDNYPLAYLSFSQLKSLLLITNLNQNTKLLLLDEPTWSMDINAVEAFIDLLNLISDKLDFSILMISHAQNLLTLLKSTNLIIENLQIKVVE